MKEPYAFTVMRRHGFEFNCTDDAKREFASFIWYTMATGIGVGISLSIVAYGIAGMLSQ